jgi:Cu+-exporting ATPase
MPNYKVHGMHCASCASIIERKLRKLPGVQTVSVSQGTETAQIDHGTVPLEQLNKTIEPLGYRLAPEARVQENIPVADHMGDHMHGDEKDAGALKRHVWVSTPIMAFSIVAMAWDIGERFGWVSGMNEITLEVVHHVLPILATYMLFVVGKPFLLGVWRFIRYGQANMDTLIGIGTLVAFLYSLVIAAFTEQLRPFIDVEIMYYDVTIIVIGFITLGKFLEVRAKSKTGAALKSLISLQAKSALVERNGQEQLIPLSEVIVGDLVHIKPGTKIPVDGIVIRGETYVDESMLTGEPMPVEKKSGGTVTGGTINRDGFIVIKATAVGTQSMLAHIINLVQSAQASKAPIQKLADRISAIFVPTILGIAGLTLVGWLVIGSQFLPFDQAVALGLSSFVAVLVIACPCALGLATPTAIIVGVGKGARQGILIKNAAILERLSKVRDIVFDKTGTITEGHPRVVDFVNKSNLSDQQVLMLAASLEKSSEHPLAQAVATLATERKVKPQPVERFVASKGKGITGDINGRTYFIGSDRFVTEISKNMLDTELLSSRSVASLTPVVLADARSVIAYFFIGDSIKKNAKQAIKQLHAEGVRAHMATGDQEQAAQAVAVSVGIDTYHARMLPEDKQLIVRDLKKKGALVAVAGDGVNDAPALASADVGIAMATGTDVAIETADITLLHGDISKISLALQLSRQTLRVVKQNLFWAFAFNVIGIPLAAGAFYAFGITLSPVFAGAAMAFSSVLVVSNSLRLKFSNT